MTDPAHKYSDEQIAAFQREVASVYAEAEKQAKAALDAYLVRYQTKDEAKRKAVEEGKVSQDEYDSWRKRMILAGKRYKQTLDECAAAYTNANKIAVEILNGTLPDIYAENMNYGIYQVESGAGYSTSYTLVDSNTIANMVMNGTAYMPARSVNVPKDIAWNRRQVSAQVTAGLLLGESIPKIAKRIQTVTDANKAVATRIARTTVTAAENAGRVNAYERAKGMGITFKQEWLATLDGRTRHSHRMVDGEQVEVGEVFSNGCRYPGDPNAPYAETANCRCTLVAGFDDMDNSWKDGASKRLTGKSYEEWKREHEAAKSKSAKDVSNSYSNNSSLIGSIRSQISTYIRESRKLGLTAPRYIPKRNKVDIPPAERKMVEHEINTYYHTRYEGKSHVLAPIGNCTYEVEIYGFDEYRIVGRWELD